MKKDILLAAACGIYCGECELLGEKCDGCGAVKGKPFWAEQYGVKACPLYACAVTDKGLEHCGLCAEFPCQTFLSMRDPSMTDEQFEKSMSSRQSALRRRGETGTAAWLDEVFGQ